MPIQPKPPTANGPTEWFTGDVFIDAIARGEAPSRMQAPGDERPEADWGEHVTDDEYAAASATER